jgi:hypothetical protein
MSSVKYQEIIDEYKEELPDGLYKKLCDLNMLENKKEEQNEDFYKIKYVIPDHYYDDDGDNNIMIKFKTKIIKLEKKIYDEVVKKIDNDGWHPSLGGGGGKDILKYKHKFKYIIVVFLIIIEATIFFITQYIRV